MKLSNMTMQRTIHISLLIAVVALLGSCSPKKLILNKAADALSGESSLVFSGEEDPKLVADALPFALKTYESVLEKAPNHKGLLIATGKAFIMYAYAFVLMPADELPLEETAQAIAARTRATKLFLRGRDYLLRALEINHPGFTTAITLGNPDSAVTSIGAQDSSLLYWTSLAWFGAINASKSNIDLLISMPRAVALMNRLYAINPSYDEGAVHEFFLSYYGGLPASMGGSETKARDHFKEALALSKGKKTGPYLSLATSVCVKNQDFREFCHLLAQVQSVDVSARTKYRLNNIINQNRATWLLENKDRFFLDTDTTESMQ